MDSKITLSFDAQVIDAARSYAESKNISLSRLTEYLLRRVTDVNAETLESLPISDWVKSLPIGKPFYTHNHEMGKANYASYYESKYDNDMIANEHSLEAKNFSKKPKSKSSKK